MDNFDERRKIFARNLTAFRTAAGISMARLAAAIDVNTSAVLRWEQGRTLPQSDALQRLAEEFARPMDDFFNPSPPPPRVVERPAVRFKIEGELDEDLRRKVNEFIAGINREQIDRVAALKKQMRKGKKL